jgi:hypothetical protein
MQEFIGNIISEFLKGAAGEAGKEGVRALFSSRTKPESLPQDEGEHLDVQDPWMMAGGFLNALLHGEPDTAWTYCDPSVADEPDRLERVNVILQAVPPMSYALLNMHVPEGWREGDWLPWGLIEAVITYPRDDGRFDALPALLTMFPSDAGWLVADVHWQESAEQTSEPSLPAARVVGWNNDWESTVAEIYILPCTRCPQSFTIPAGYGVLKVKCPACWTLQEVET